MSEKIIRTSIPECWLDTLNEEVKPLLQRTEFFVEENTRGITFRWLPCISVRLQMDESDERKEFLFGLSGNNIEDVYEKALKEFVLDKIGHRI